MPFVANSANWNDPRAVPVFCVRGSWQSEQADRLRIQKLWELKRPAIGAHIEELYEEVRQLEQEIDDILMEKILNK